MRLDMPRNWQEIASDDMSGGITDYVDNAKPNQSALIENFMISRDRGLIVRDGSDQWNEAPLPNSLEALQLFQLEEYIFAYTNDGDIYWTLDTGIENWTQIQTAADIGADWGGDFFKVGDSTLYIVPDPAIQAVEPWDKIKCVVTETINNGAGINVINAITEVEPDTGLSYFRFEFVYYTDNPKTFTWTSSLTTILDNGLAGQGPWEVWLDDTQLVSPHIEPVIDTVTDGTTTLDFTASGNTDFGYRPIYLNRVKPFIDSTFNGSLSVSKFSGHLYLALYPDDRSWSANPSDVFSDQPDVYQIDNKRLPLRKIYLLYDPDTDTTTPKCTSAQLPNCDVTAYPADGGSGVGDESKQYLYEAYARHTYYALVEGEPRLFIVDGPSKVIQYLTQYEPSPSNPVKVSGRLLPRIQYNVEIYPLEELDFRFFRTQQNGTVPTLVNAIDGTLGLIYGNWANQWGTLNPDLESAWNTGDGDQKGLFYFINQDTGSTDEERRRDVALDADILGNEESYDATTDFGYINIPQGPYFFTVSNQIGYYADIFKLKNRVYQSIYGVPHANIAISFLDFDDGITGINTFRDKAIVFTRESVWRMEGVRGLDGRGSISQRLVSDEFGAISNQTIIRTNYGLFFFARTGICYTDGFKTLRVSEQLFDSYYEMIQDVDYIRGIYHESEQRIHWAVKYKNKTYWLILNLRFGISPEMPMTLCTGVDWLDIPDDEVNPATLVDRFDPRVSHVNETDQRILRHTKTYINVHDSQYTYDRYPIEFPMQVPIVFDWKSQAHSMGSKRHRKWVSNCMLTMRETGDNGVSLQPVGYNDLGDTARLCGACWSYGKMEYGDPEQMYGNPDATYAVHKQVSFKRMFPEGSVRATYKQVGIKSLYVVGLKSDDDGLGIYTSVVNAGIYRTYITIPQPLAVAASRMLVSVAAVTDNSGQFGIKLPKIRGEVFYPIHKVVDNTTSFDVYIDPDYDQDSSQTLTNIEWAIGEIRLAERIGLDSYSLRYTVIGDRTHGEYQTEDGASQGDGNAPS
jgi:hypothetical protein